MEKKIKGFVIERSDNIDTLSFKIKVSEVTICNVINCYRVSTDPDAMAEGVECYKGNIVLDAEFIIRNVSACLWVYPDNSCVIVYND